MDEAVGLEARRLVAPGLRKRSLWPAAEMSYEKAAEGVRKLCGIAVSEGTMKNLAAEEGTEVLAQKEDERRRVWEQGEDVASGDGKKRVFVQVDGMGINDRASKGWFEAKVGIIFSETKKVSKDRVEILEKLTYAVYVLDFRHLAKNIRVCLGAERKGLINELLGLASRGASEELLKRLSRLMAYSRDPTFSAPGPQAS